MDDKEATSLRLKLRGIARTPLDGVEAGTLVKVRGFVTIAGVPAVAPVSGAPCAVYGVEANLVHMARTYQRSRDRDDYRVRSTVPLAGEVGGRDLLIDDGTGRALVRVDNARLSLLGVWKAAFASAHTSFIAKQTPQRFDDHAQLEYREVTVVAGEILTVFGCASIEADAAPAASLSPSYRHVSMHGVFAPGPQCPLFIIQEHVTSLEAVG